MITTAGSRDHRNNRDSVSVSVTEGRKLYRVVERRIRHKYCKCNGEWRSRIWRKKRNERKSKMVEIHPRDSHIHFHFQLRGYFLQRYIVRELYLVISFLLNSSFSSYHCCCCSLLLLLLNTHLHLLFLCCVNGAQSPGKILLSERLMVILT